jgi:DNA-binding NarL/FixJ family response regulator
MKAPRTVRSLSQSVRRTRVLVADDHSHVLEMIVEQLAADFEIVAAASDGRQALELLFRLDPDIAVLDINMPGLDGFQVLRELRRTGSRAKVLLLTLHQNDEFIIRAIQSGAHGYVLKTRMRTDLMSAIDHALAGRLFAPSLTSLSRIPRAGHIAQFHSDDPFFLNEVSQFILATIRSGELLVVVATEQTRTGIAQRLEEFGMDLAAMTAQEQYVVMDAAESLSHFMRDGRTDASRLSDVVADLDRLRLSSPRGPQSRLTVFGEMAGLLCRDGRFAAAVEVERIWNNLTRSLPFLTVCSYPIECFMDETSRKMVPIVCAEHLAISHSMSA